MSAEPKQQSDLPQTPYTLPKIPTGIVGLDEVLNGGIPEESMTLFTGGPGTGKTILGLEFLVRGAQAGHPGIMLTFEEREQDLRNYAIGFGWDIKALEKKDQLVLISARIQPDAILSGDFDLRGILAILKQKADLIQARRVLIDAPDVFLRLLDDIAKERAELHILNEWLREAGMTTIMTVKGKSESAYSSHYEFLEYMANCVINLDQRVFQQVTTRRMRIVKYRGSTYGRNEYPFGMTQDGVWIIPVTQTNLKHRELGDPLPSGIAELDTILGGGYRKNSCTLITGSSGTGKTTFACSFAISATSRNEKLLYLDFEESWDALVSCMRSTGLDLQTARDSGQLHFISAMPETQGIEEHLIQAFRAINEFRPDHLVLDAISACRRMGSEQAAFDYLLRLVDRCKQMGITSLLTNLTAWGSEEQEITGIDLSSVIDTVIVLRYTETENAFERKMAVIKSRGLRHSNKIHPFEITGSGIEISRR
jgi:circadian clock protein KaiC